MRRYSLRIVPRLVLGIVLWIILLPLSAVANEVTLKDIVDSDDDSAALKLQSSTASQSPLATAIAIRAAGKERDWDAVAEYADFRFLPDHVLEQGRIELIRKLAIMWEQHQLMDLTSLSDKPEGALDDGLPSYREELGSLHYGEKEFVVYLQHVPAADGQYTWKISNATIAQVPEMWTVFGYDPRLERIGQWLPEGRIFHMQNWQAFLLVALFVLAWLSTGLLKKLLLAAISRSQLYRDTMQRLIRRPLRLCLFFGLVHWGVYQLGLPLRVRVFFDSGIFLYLSVMFMVLGIIEFATALYISRALKQDENYSPGFLRPVISIVKIVIIVLALLFWLDNAGYNMATVLTGLGIGSLAVALAAQKTLENVFGAFTLYIARPIKPGDLCRFGGVLGVVEEIGLRSTRLRQLNRTIVNVPNSVFSSKELENLSEIDRRLFRQRFCISHKTDSKTLHQVLEQLRDILAGHELVLELARRVYFENISREGFEVQVNAYIATADYAEYLSIAEALNLQMLDVLEQAGVALVHWSIPASSDS